MIEVEIRGPLTEEEAVALKATLATQGKQLATKEREMILLIDGYPGHDRDPSVRTSDIRLKRTNGKCEIVVKHKLSEGSVGRREISLPLATDNLDVAKQVVAAFGATQGLWMQRTIDLYQTSDGIEWAIGRASHRSGDPVLHYFEAELEAADTSKIETAKQQLLIAARALGLDPITDDLAMRDWLFAMDAAVNDEIELTI